MKTWQKMVVSMIAMVVMMYLLIRVFALMMFGARFYLDRWLVDSYEQCERQGLGLAAADCSLAIWPRLGLTAMFQPWFYLGVPIVVSGVMSGVVLRKTLWKNK